MLWWTRTATSGYHEDARRYHVFLPTFVFIEVLNECTVLDRLKLLNLLQPILEMSPGTLIFIIGRPDVDDEIK